jgi:hypothetical protein
MLPFTTLSHSTTQIKNTIELGGIIKISDSSAVKHTFFLRGSKGIFQAHCFYHEGHEEDYRKCALFSCAAGAPSGAIKDSYRA